MDETGGRGTVVILNGPGMGRGDDALGAKLLANYLRALVGLEPKPEALVFYNAAVMLLGPDSASLDALRALDDAGVDLLACVTCLEFFGLTDKLAIGQVSSMREIAARMLRAGKVVAV